MSPWWLRPAADDKPGASDSHDKPVAETSRARSVVAPDRTEAEPKPRKSGGQRRRSKRAGAGRSRKPAGAGEKSTGNRLAILLDLGAFAAALGEREPAGAMANLLKVLTGHGQPDRVRVYGDPELVPMLLESCRQAGYEVVERVENGAGLPRAHLQLAVDAMELCQADESFDTLVLVAADDRWQPLAEKVKKLGKKIVGVGPRTAVPSAVIHLFDSYLDLEELPSGATATAADGRIEPAKAPIFELLVETIGSLEQGGAEVLWGSVLKRAMHERHPEFEEAQHGYRTFSDLLEDADRCQVIQLERDDRSGNYYVAARTSSDVLP